VATVPADICVSDDFWCRFALLVEAYVILTERRIQRPLRRLLEQKRASLALTDQLGAQLRGTLREYPGWGSRQDLYELWPIKRWLEKDIEVLEILTDSRFWAGRNDAHRQFLYGGVLDLWTGSLGLSLKYQRGRKPPDGKLIQFFSAVVGPLLGSQAPGVHAIARIIDLERQRRASHAAYWASYWAARLVMCYFAHP
jgi:hypothetical protein